MSHPCFGIGNAHSVPSSHAKSMKWVLFRGVYSSGSRGRFWTWTFDKGCSCYDTGDSLEGDDICFMFGDGHVILGGKRAEG